MKKITLRKRFGKFVVKYGTSYHTFDEHSEAWRFVFAMRAIDNRIRGTRRTAI